MAISPYGIDPRMISMIPPSGGYGSFSGLNPIGAQTPNSYGQFGFGAATQQIGATPGPRPTSNWDIPQFNYNQMQDMSAFIPTPTQQIQTMYANTGAPAAQRANAAAAAGQPNPNQQPAASSGGSNMTDVLAALTRAITSSQAAGATTYQPQVTVTPTSASMTSTTNPNIGMK